MGRGRVTIALHRHPSATCVAAAYGWSPFHQPGSALGGRTGEGEAAPSSLTARRVAVLGTTEPSARELLLRVNDAIMAEDRRVWETDLLAERVAL